MTRLRPTAITFVAAVWLAHAGRLVKRLYVEPLEKVRPDWPVIEIKDAGHFTCIAKEQFREEIAAWLKKQIAVEKDGSRDKPAR